MKETLPTVKETPPTVKETPPDREGVAFIGHVPPESVSEQQFCSQCEQDTLPKVNARKIQRAHYVLNAAQVTV